MALKTRIVPVVCFDGVTAVQTVRFRDMRSIGSLRQQLRVYERRSCDELLVVDIAATRERRVMDDGAVEWLSSEIFCPLTVGGGVVTVEQAVSLIQHGADKVVVGSGASRPFLQALSHKIGNQSVVAALDIGEETLEFACAWAMLLAEAGAGEILLTSIQQQGTRSGYDVELLRAVSKSVRIPVVINGGCSGPEDMLVALRSGAHAVAAGALFAFTEHTPMSCARWLDKQGVPVRLD